MITLETISLILITIITMINNLFFKKKCDLQNLKEEMKKETESKVNDKNCIKKFSNPDLQGYYILFDIKIKYTKKMINQKFSKGTLSWSKYMDLLNEAQRLFNEEMESANTVWKFIAINDNSKLSDIYNKKINNINEILEGVEELMIQFMTNEKKKDDESLNTLLEEIKYSQKVVDLYVQE